MNDEWGLSTRSIHVGWQPDPATGAVKRPLVMANSYVLPPDGDWDAVPFGYARDLNPNARWLEERLQALEGGEDCVVTASGVSAINGTFMALLSSGDHIICSDISYVSVRTMLLEHFPKRFGIETTLLDTSDVAAVAAAIRPNTKIIHVETPGNPTTRISDLAAIAEIAHAHGALLTVDSTWSGLTTQHPFVLGADIVMHSISKYINGHGDALGGAVFGPKALMDVVRLFVVKDMGACISPFNAWQVMRGVATLELRMARHNENAMRVAEYLEAHPKVAFVRYPGLKSHPNHAVAVRQMHGFSSMLNFDLVDQSKRAEFIAHLKVFVHAVSLGHDESLIFVYTDATTGESFYRVSIGIENVEDLIADLAQALALC
ncbi:MAG: PLP-dependent transferase [Chloroflexi bacterium]|nr:PLP-dependent transferase [Chloroflexota bacterium]